MKEIQLLEPMDGGKPTHYIINNTSERTWNTTYNDIDMYEEAKKLEENYFPNMIEYGDIKDLKKYKLVNELDVIISKSKANNKDKIL